MNKKRFLSVLLSVCMVFTMFPMAATAGTTSGTAADTLCGGWTTIADTNSSNCYQPFGIAMYEGPATDSNNGHQMGYGYSNVFVADSFSSNYNIIRKWDGSSWSTIPGPSGGFGNYLVGAAVNKDEDIFIACAGALTSKAIWKYDSSGSTWTDITAGHSFANARGIAVLGDFVLVLAMKGGAPSIAIYGLSTQGVWTEGAVDASGISNFNPVAIAAPYNGDADSAYLLDSSGKIYKCSAYGDLSNPTFTCALVATAPDGSGYSGLTVLPDYSGTQNEGYDFYVANSSNKCVEAILHSGSSNPSSWEKMQYGSSNQFNSPTGIVVNCDGNMYVADNYLVNGSTCDSKIVTHSSIPAQLVWSTQPGGGVTGKALSQQPVLTLKDTYGNTKSDDSKDQMTVSIASGSGTLNGTATVTLNSGVATFSDLGITGPGSYTLTANCGGIKGISANFTIANTAAAAQSTVTASPSSVTADGSGTSTITVTLNDSGGSPVTGKTVALSQNGGHSTITTVSGTTNASGQATFTVKSTKAETVTYTATDQTDNVTVSQTAQVQFVAGSVSSAQSTVTASPASVTADGSGTSTITVTLKDSNANPVSGKTVALAQNSGASSTITTVSGTTNSSGQATFTVKNTKVETVTYTATDQTDSVTVSQTAQVQFVAGSASKLVFTGAALQGTMGNLATVGPITVTAEDQNGNVAKVNSDTVVNLNSNSAGTAVFSKTSGGQAVTSVTIAAGSSSTSFYYGDTKTGTPTITASAPGLTSGTQSETITAAPALAVSVQSGGSSYVSGSWTKNSITFDLSDTVQNPDSITYQVSTDNGNSWTDLSSGASGSHGSYTVSTAGTQNLQFRIKSVAGSTSNVISYTVKIDTTAPGNVSISFSTSPFKTVLHFLT
ncbi:MAG: invasin domain 3-containing protein, partial [Clostridia bacterium]|nr:invasin domain 3-containing protein [Clostridia bacterium]